MRPWGLHFTCICRITTDLPTPTASFFLVEKSRQNFSGALKLQLLFSHTELTAHAACHRTAFKRTRAGFSNPAVSRSCSTEPLDINLVIDTTPDGGSRLGCRQQGSIRYGREIVLTFFFCQAKWPISIGLRLEMVLPRIRGLPSYTPGNVASAGRM